MNVEIYAKTRIRTHLIMTNGLIALLSLLMSKKTLVSAIAMDGITSPTSSLGKDTTLAGACQINLTLIT